MPSFYYINLYIIFDPTGCKGSVPCRVRKLADMALSLPHTRCQLEEPVLRRSELGNHTSFRQRQLEDRMISQPNSQCLGIILVLQHCSGY